MLSLIILAASMTQARSVYVINDTDTSKMYAYKVEDANLVYQTDYHFVSEDWGSVGLAIDESEYGQFLFATFETSDKIEVVNAKTMEYVDTVKAIGASNIAGIVVDQDKVYVIDRGENHLYIYSWDAENKQISLDLPYPYYIELEDCEQGYGLALDEENDRLYVADNTTTVKCYDANDPNWSKLDDFTFTVTDEAIGIAVDVNNGHVYTGNGNPSGSTKLSRYDLSAESETTVDVCSPVLGIAVDQQTSLVYITTFGSGLNPDRLIIYDSNLVKQPWESGDIGNPAGVAVAGNVSYKPPFPFVVLVKDDNDVDCALPLISEAEHELLGTPYNWLYYNIHYDANGHADTNVVITDYLPLEVDYYSSDPCGLYDANTHTVTWDINDMSASDSNTFWIQVGVNACAMPGQTIRNYCEIESDLYCSFTAIDTNICFWSPDIIYVDVNAVGCNSGLSWYHADPDLQSALQKAQAWDCKQIWVAEGMYKPTNSSDRLISFELLDGITIYGGFPTGGGTLFDRDPNAYETILSGDIATPFDQNDNSYHVVKCEDVNNAVLDGFTITAGNANGDELNQCGGGIYCEDSNDLTVTNCAFSGNLAFVGGGMYNRYEPSPTVVNCTFKDNTVHFSYSTYGGGICNYQSSPTLINCTFSGNSAITTGQYSSYGGAICNWDDSDPNISNCTFSNNSADKGGAVCNDYSAPNIINCIFTGNTAGNFGGGGMYNYRSSAAVANCIFTGNTAVYYGGGICNWDYSDANVTNCIFSGNSAGYGGGMQNWDSYPTVTNCTFSENFADYGGGMYNGENSVPNVTNCILWTDKAGTSGDEIYNYDVNSDPNISYSDIKGGWTGTGKTFQSTLTKTGASWTINELAGKFVNPYTLQYLQFFIVSNDINTINVWSDVTAIAEEGDTYYIYDYHIYDYHLRVDSACVDAGYLEGDYTGQTDIDGEPRVFDGDYNGTDIVDMGADEYYWSPADFNSDGLVNFFDYSLFADAWQSEPNDYGYSDVYDFVDNNCIDSNDLARFCEDWLWQTAWAKTFPCAYDQTMGLGMDKSMAESLGFTEALFPSAPAEKTQPELTTDDIEEIIKWLAELWLTDDDVRKMISEDDWLKFTESVIQVLKQQIYN